MTDPIKALKALRPDPSRFEPDSDALDRILSAPQEPPRGRRSRMRLGVAAGAAAAVAAAIFVVAMLAGRSPDVVARAAEALNAPRTIVHYRAHRQELPLHSGDVWTEDWQTTDGLRHHSVQSVPGPGETAFDATKKTLLTYNPALNLLLRHTDPDFFDRSQVGVDRFLFDPAQVSALAKLFARARAGDASVRKVGEPSVRGIATYELRVPLARDLVRYVYLDKRTYLPVRLVELRPGGYGEQTDYYDLRTLPLTARTERLLRMRPHPGAKHEVEGRIR
jgi:hypothetical protein